MANDYYNTLGVAKDASDDEIKKAYRRMALQHHPDKHKGDKDTEQKFKEINEAYQVLSDKQKRAQYDRFGSAGGAQGFGGGGAGFGDGGFDFSNFSGASGFGDIFETFFGGGMGGGGQRGKRGPRPGNDIEVAITLSFEEAAFGVEKELSITKPATCKHCQGSGAEPGSKTVTCPTCNGTGEVRSVRQTIFGNMAVSQPCPKCHGEGRMHEKQCTVCQGSTRTRTQENIKVKIPAGVDNDSAVRLSGRGEAGIFGGPNGDLYVHIRVTPSKKFIRHDHDIHSETHIHFLQAILGDDIEIETIHGNVTLKIPAGTQSDKVFRLKEHGIQKLRSDNKGDHYVKIIVDIPTKISRKEREIYLELAKESKIPVKVKEGFLSRLMG